MFELLWAKQPLLTSNNSSFACWQCSSSFQPKLAGNVWAPACQTAFACIWFKNILSHLTVILDIIFYLALQPHLTAILYLALQPSACMFVWLPFFFCLLIMFGLFCPKHPFACVEVELASWQSLARLFVQLPFLICLLAMLGLFCPKWPFARDEDASRRYFTWPYGRASQEYFIWPCGRASWRYWLFLHLTAMINFFCSSWQYWFFFSSQGWSVFSLPNGSSSRLSGNFKWANPQAPLPHWFFDKLFLRPFSLDHSLPSLGTSRLAPLVASTMPQVFLSAKCCHALTWLAEAQGCSFYPCWYCFAYNTRW